ncbi:hypothetical protein MRX96_031032 [Rhipicephalus microplus]
MRLRRQPRERGQAWPRSFGPERRSLCESTKRALASDYDIPFLRSVYIQFSDRSRFERTMRAAETTLAREKKNTAARSAAAIVRCPAGARHLIRNVPQNRFYIATHLRPQC